MNESQSNSVPTFEEREAMWRVFDFPRHPALYPRTQEYADALRERFASGSVLFQSFSIPTDPVFDWYLERNRLHECNFFERFWKTPTPTSIFQQSPAPLNYYDTSLFQWTTPFHLAGDLSSVIFSGGAYSRTEGYGREARRLGEAAAAELLADDYEQTLFFHCNSAWSDFFSDIAWDYTAVVISKPQRLVHALIATDTD